MSGHPQDLGELRSRLNEVNAEYQDLVRDSRDTSRLARMAELRKARLDLMTRILNAEGGGTTGRLDSRALVSRGCRSAIAHAARIARVAICH